MASNYQYLTDAEKCYYNAYTRLRELSDWEGFTSTQGSEKDAARAWLVNQRKEIWRCAEGKKPDKCKPGWDVSNRRQRYEFLKDANLNSGSPGGTLCQLPTGAGTPSEKCMISEREMWWNQNSVDDTTKKWRQHNADVLTSRRKQVYSLMQSDPANNTSANRSQRYQNLCIATKYGDAYTNWSKSHNTTTGASTSSGKSARSKCKDWLDSYIGVHESPDGSNKGNPQPSTWQKRVYGSDGVPWCACFAGCSSWDNGVSGQVTAGVANNVSLAKQGKGIYRGWTNDPSKVHAGDHAFIGSDHTGVIYDASDCTTVEGNTSASGSQWNGGQVAKKKRGWGYWSAGFGIVDYPD